MLNSVYTLSCPECGHVWESKEAFPERCPKCKILLNVDTSNLKDCTTCDYGSLSEQFNVMVCPNLDCVDWNQWKAKEKK